MRRLIPGLVFIFVGCGQSTPHEGRGEPDASGPGSASSEPDANEPGDSPSEPDVAPPPRLDIEATSLDLPENVDDFAFIVRRSGDRESEVSVEWRVVPSGPNPVSVRDFEGDVLPADLITLGPGDEASSVTVPVKSGAFVEGDETFSVELFNAQGAELGIDTVSGVIREPSVPVPNPNPNPANATCTVDGKTLAFPDAQGFGRFASGGRGGKVVFVTNTNDSGPGSLRHALENATGRRTVVFRTGGVIKLRSGIGLSDSGVTIAGQTAPGDGILITDHSLVVRSSNVIVRGMRFRPGYEGDGESTDGLCASNNGKPIRNVIFDHNSVSWTKDEGICAWYDTQDVTFSNNLISFQPNKGILVGPNTNRVSVYRNAFVHVRDRNPRVVISNDGVAEIVNNYMYNCQFCTRILTSTHRSSGGSDVHVLDNYYDTTASQNGVLSKSNPGKRFIRGNIWVQGAGEKAYQGSTANQPVFASLIDADAYSSAADVPSSLLADAGARWPTRDEIDQSAVNDAMNGRRRGRGTYDLRPKDFNGYPSYARGAAASDRDNDGIPDTVEALVGGDPDRFDSDESTAFGYTRLELYINGIITGDYQTCL